jgi:hypothetical protein
MKLHSAAATNPARTILRRLPFFFPLEKSSSSFGFWLLSQQEHNPVQKQRGTTVT